MAIILRSVKGSPLTVAELDGNFTDLDGRVVTLEGAGSGKQIDFIEQVEGSNSITIHYTDSSTDGPFELGQFNFNFRGAWAADTIYTQYDVVTANGSVYLVLQTHTSESVFDAGASNSDGDFYGLLLTNPDNVLPVGGAEGEVLAKASATDFDVAWVDAPGSLVVPSVSVVSANTFDINSLTYANVYFRMTHVDGCTVTIPSDGTLALDIGTELHFRQCDIGPVVLVAGSDSDETVLLNPIDGYDTVTGAQGAVVTAKKINTNEWDVWGLLAPVS